jgi:hypothetical protein
MSYNLPILLSDIPANKEVVLSEETFPVWNVEALSQKLQSVIESPLAMDSPQIIAKKIASRNWIQLECYIRNNAKQVILLLPKF